MKSHHKTLIKLLLEEMLKSSLKIPISKNPILHTNKLMIEKSSRIQYNRPQGELILS